MSRKKESKRFRPKDAEMTLTAIGSLESARRQFFMNLDANHVYKVRIKRFLAQDAKMTLTGISSIESSQKKIFHELVLHDF